MTDRFTNPAQSLALLDRIKQVADEHTVGGHFEGESKRERSVGKEREVVVDIFKREYNPLADLATTKPGTYFMRVSLRSATKPILISRFEIDIDRYSTERELLGQALVGGGALAETDNKLRGADWDPDYVAKQAQEAMRELLRDIEL